MFKETAILALFFALASTGVVPEWEGRVVGGNTATPGQFPWIVSLRYRDNTHFCGAAIISSRNILSAAHCFVGTNAVDIVAYVGAHHISRDGTRISIETITSHELYNQKGEMEYDIAILKTYSSIPGFATRQIQLANRAPIVGETVTVAGWGYTWYESGKPPTSPEFLQYLNKRVISGATCTERHGYPAPPSTLCTESPKGQGSCMGDSGGPLVSQNRELLGVVSWGIPCAVGYPDMYGNVFNLQQWIVARMV